MVERRSCSTFSSVFAEEEDRAGEGAMEVVAFFIRLRLLLIKHRIRFLKGAQQGILHCAADYCCSVWEEE
eukprot:761241-Hanusia_phi.AAC.2